MDKSREAIPFVELESCTHVFSTERCQTNKVQQKILYFIQTRIRGEISLTNLNANKDKFKLEAMVMRK